jgi:uncharacterized protein (TIGR03084 family)
VDRAEHGDPVDALAEQQAALIALVEHRSDAELLAPSRCEGWTVADVLLHLAQTNEMAVASVEGRLGEHVDRVAASVPAAGDIDAWAGALVDLERGEPSRSRDRYLVSAAAQLDAFRSASPAARVQWVAGDMAARTLATTRLTETWIHTVDVAVAYGSPPEPTDRLWHTCRLTWRTVPYALARSGVAAQGEVAFVLDAPDGSTWAFGEPATAPTVLRGTASDLCTVAGQRAAAADTSLRATGPDADAVLRLVRTFA